MSHKRVLWGDIWPAHSNQAILNSKWMFVPDVMTFPKWYIMSKEHMVAMALTFHILTTKFESGHHWCQVNISTRFEELPSKCYWDKYVYFYPVPYLVWRKFFHLISCHITLLLYLQGFEVNAQHTDHKHKHNPHPLLCALIKWEPIKGTAERCNLNMQNRAELLSNSPPPWSCSVRQRKQNNQGVKW